MTKILFLSHPDCVDFAMEAWANPYNALYDSGICLIMVHVDRFIFFFAMILLGLIIFLWNTEQYSKIVFNPFNFSLKLYMLLF